MNILADENIKEEPVYALRRGGHDVAWVREDSPRVNDRIVLARAMSENRLLITYDKGFGNLVFGERLPASCGVVLFTFSGEPSQEERAQLIAGALSANVQWQRMFRKIAFKFDVPPNLERPTQTRR